MLSAPTEGKKFDARTSVSALVMPPTCQGLSRARLGFFPIRGRARTVPGNLSPLPSVFVRASSSFAASITSSSPSEPEEPRVVDPVYGGVDAAEASPAVGGCTGGVPDATDAVACWSAAMSSATL